MTIRLLTVAIMLFALGNPAWADFKIQAWSFDQDTPGSPPAGFVIGQANGEGGRWEVATDAKAMSPPYVLGRIPSNKPGPAPQMIFLDGIEAVNLDLTVRIKVSADGDGQGGGAVFRAQDDRNYYVVWLSPQEKLVRIDRIVNGDVRHLQDLSVDAIEIGTWHTLRLTIRSAEMEALYDNRQFISAREEAWEFGRYKAGKVGLWASGSAATYFDNVRYTSMDGGTGSAPLGGTESTIIK